MHPNMKNKRNAIGKTRKSKVRPATPSMRVDLKQRHNMPMTSKIKKDDSKVIANSRVKV
jgi:hypothetical protein